MREKKIMRKFSRERKFFFPFLFCKLEKKSLLVITDATQSPSILRREHFYFSRISTNIRFFSPQTFKFIFYTSDTVCCVFYLYFISQVSNIISRTKLSLLFKINNTDKKPLHIQQFSYYYYFLFFFHAECTLKK